jgi:8-oxo-dGTP pyrophosphatase MutT (NUDIX family)
VTYSPKKAGTVLGSFDTSAPRPTNAPDYKESKKVWTSSLARAKKLETGATWCISESGACGPTFNYPDLSLGFTAVFVSGPIERGVFIESPHADREQNMWAFAKAALDLLQECVEEASKMGDEEVKRLRPDEAPVLEAKEDRYGGVEVEVPKGISSGDAVTRFANELRAGLAKWQAAGKAGIWLKVPTCSAFCVGPATASGFAFHHAKPEYALLTRWLPTDKPSPLPMYGFTQIGVGGVVVNSKNEVLMVQERVAPMAMFQNSWKLPGGLADPGEDFAETVAREVVEETGVTASLEGVVSLRHKHGVRFGQGDLYVLVKLRATKEEISIDTKEIKDAKWMSLDVIKSLVAEQGASLDGKVSPNNVKMITNALHGSLIKGEVLPNSRGVGRSDMFYTAPSA